MCVIYAQERLSWRHRRLVGAPVGYRYTSGYCRPRQTGCRHRTAHPDTQISWQATGGPIRCHASCTSCHLRCILRRVSSGPDITAFFQEFCAGGVRRHLAAQAGRALTLETPFRTGTRRARGIAVLSLRRGMVRHTPAAQPGIAAS